MSVTTRSSPRLEERPAPRVQRVPLTRRERLLRAANPRLRLPQVVLLLTLLGIWELAGTQSQPYTFAPPTAVVSALADMIKNGELMRALGNSLTALAVGFTLAAVCGVAVGFAMGFRSVLGRTLDPFVAALYVVPVAAVVPVIVAWIGPGRDARILVIFLFGVFEPLLTVAAGTRSIDPTLVETARSFGARGPQIVRRVLLPASLPYVFVGLRMGAARAVTGMVIAEMLFATTGLGGLIIDSAADFRIDRVLAVVVTVSLIGILLTGAIRIAERHALKWQPND